MSKKEYEEKVFDNMAKRLMLYCTKITDDQLMHLWDIVEYEYRYRRALKEQKQRRKESI